MWSNSRFLCLWFLLSKATNFFQIWSLCYELSKKKKKKNTDRIVCFPFCKTLINFKFRPNNWWLRGSTTVSDTLWSVISVSSAPILRYYDNRTHKLLTLLTWVVGPPPPITPAALRLDYTREIPYLPEIYIHSKNSGQGPFRWLSMRYKYMVIKCTTL